MDLSVMARCHISALPAAATVAYDMTRKPLRDGKESLMWLCVCKFNPIICYLQIYFIK